jgi:hypothetical protein
MTGQLTVVKCQLKSYMTLTQDELHAQDLTGKIQEINKQLAALSSTSPGQISPSITEIIEKQTSDRDAYAADLKATNDQMQAINQSLERQECGQ